MQATVAIGDPTLEVPPAKLLREPLFWASAAAFVGVAVGLAGTFSWAALMVVWRGPEANILGALSLLGVPGYILGALSLLGVPILLGWGSRTLRIGTALLLAWLPLWLAVELAYLLSPLFYPSLWSPKGLPSPVLTVASVATTVLGSAAVLSLALGVFFKGARRLGAVLLILGLPGDLLFFGVHNALTGTNEISTQIAVTSTLLFGAELGVAEACLFTLLAVMLLGGARGGRAPAGRGELQEGLAPLRGGPCQERSLGGGGGGLQGLPRSPTRRERQGSHEALRCGSVGQLPGLEVSVVSQEAEGNVVKTRLVLSGTDRGSGVMWYPPTGRWVSFEAEFTDRLRGGELVEHTGWVDNEALLRQLGHHREG